MCGCVIRLRDILPLRTPPWRELTRERWSYTTNHLLKCYETFSASVVESGDTHLAIASVHRLDTIHSKWF
jgi:hypothetical protein